MKDHVDNHDRGSGGGYKTLRGRKYPHLWNLVGWNSSVDIGTCYGLEGPGIECRRGEIFRTRSDSARESIQPPM
jgi:hypothetical protein